jgi:hypothetical protein
MPELVGMQAGGDVGELDSPVPPLTAHVSNPDHRTGRAGEHQVGRFLAGDMGGELVDQKSWERHRSGGVSLGACPRERAVVEGGDAFDDVDSPAQ